METADKLQIKVLVMNSHIIFNNTQVIYVPRISNHTNNNDSR